MLDAARQAVLLARGRRREDLDLEDDPLLPALIHLVTVIGEAAKGVSDETRAGAPELPWKDMARMRDRLVHRYFDIDRDILWDTVRLSLPELILMLESALGEAASPSRS